MKYTIEELKEFEKFKSSYAKMAWYLLECDFIYHSQRDFNNTLNIHSDWIKIRTISDEQYDQRRAILNNLAEALGESNSPKISIQPNSPSGKVVLENLSKSPEHPISWPSNVETYEFMIFMLQKLLSKNYIKNLNNYHKKVSGF